MTHRPLARPLVALVLVACATLLAPVAAQAQPRFALSLGSRWAPLEERFVAAHLLDVPALRLDLLEPWAAAARRERLLPVWAASPSELVGPSGGVTFVVGPGVPAGPSGPSHEGQEWLFGLGLRF